MAISAFPVSITLGNLSNPYYLDQSEFSALIACNPGIESSVSFPKTALNQLNTFISTDKKYCRFYKEFGSLLKKLTTAHTASTINDLVKTELEWLKYGIYCHESKAETDTCKIQGSPFPKFLNHDYYKSYLELLKTKKIEPFEGNIDLMDPGFQLHCLIVEVGAQTKHSLNIIKKFEAHGNPADNPTEENLRKYNSNLMEMQSRTRQIEITALQLKWRLPTEVEEESTKPKKKARNEL